MIKRLLSFALFFAADCLAQSAAVPGATITGTLTGSDGTAIAGGFVIAVPASSVPPSQTAQPLVTAKTGSGGAFQLDNLRFGTFRLCVQVPGTAWLNPCEWGLNPPSVNVTAKSPAAGITIVLRKGAIIPIRINDSGNLLAQYEGKTPGAHLLLGVTADAHAFHLASVVSADAAGRNQQVVLPFDTTKALTISSSYFKLSDVNGSALPAGGANILINVPSGQQAGTVTLVVTGGGH